jgi:hypothetical protein
VAETLEAVDQFAAAADALAVHQVRVAIDRARASAGAQALADDAIKAIPDTDATRGLLVQLTAVRFGIVQANALSLDPGLSLEGNTIETVLRFKVLAMQQRGDVVQVAATTSCG